MLLEKLNSHIPKKKMNYLNSYLGPYWKINSKWIINLNVKPKMIAPVEENMSENLCDLMLQRDFLDMSSKALFIKGK